MVVVTRKINAAQIETFLGVYLRQEGGDEREIE